MTQPLSADADASTPVAASFAAREVTDSAAAADVATGYHLPQRTKLLIMGGAMLAMFLSSMEQTVVSTALPRIVSELNGLNLIAWVVTAFMLTSVTTVPVAGRLSDIYGRKPLLLVGLVVFLTGSALSGFAQDMTQLVLFRGLQGFGAGALMSNTMAISGDLFPPSERGKYMGLFAGIFGISAIIGPTLGGFLTDQLSWRWVFWINLPLGVFSVFAILFFMPWIRPSKRKVRIDYLGVVTLAWALVPGLLALALVGDDATWNDPHILLMFAASVVGLGAFIFNESRAAEPIVPLELFKNRTFTTAAITMVGMGVGVFGVIFFIPLFVQGVIGKTATESGSILTPQMLAVVVMAAVSGQVMSRTGRYKFMAVGGSVILLVAIISMTQLNVNSSLGDVVWRQILFGLGMGSIFPVLMLAVQNALPQRYLGTVSSSNQFFQQVGGLVGITVFGTLLNNHVASAVSEKLPPELAAVANPQQLVDPRQREAIIDRLGMDTFLQVADVTRNALADAITGNFVIAAAVAGIIVLAMLTLRELKLRGADDLEGATELRGPRPSLAPDRSSDGTLEPRPPVTPVPAVALATAGAPAAGPDPPPAAVPLAAVPVAATRERSTAPPLWRLIVDARLPGWTLSPRRRAELAGAVFVGSVLGLAASVSARNGNGKATSRRARSQPRGGRLWEVRRRLADRLDPPAPEPRRRRWW